MREQPFQATVTRREVIVQHQVFQGPLPPPEVFRAYEEVCPGAAARIMTQFETQGDHRRASETRRLKQNGRGELVGQIMAFLIFGGALYFGWDLLKTGHDLAGYVSLVAGLAIPIGLFLKKSLDERRVIASKPKAEIAPPS